ncbi:MAG: hypothetical protein HC819_19455 [Cyclobacteriaceae bacterium]|nr:hypothetical protein [Cyclobacteriaceae bacterium]
MKRVTPLETKFCRFLKAKNPFGTLEGGNDDWYTYDDANTIYWCVKSMGAGGPDNGPVDPRLCVSGRKCYRDRD